MAFRVGPARPGSRAHPDSSGGLVCPGGPFPRLCKGSHDSGSAVRGFGPAVWRSVHVVSSLSSPVLLTAKGAGEGFRGRA